MFRRSTNIKSELNNFHCQKVFEEKRNKEKLIRKYRKN